MVKWLTFDWSITITIRNLSHDLYGWLYNSSVSTLTRVDDIVVDYLIFMTHLAGGPFII